MRRLLMRRQFLGHTGGHQKMFDYHQHAVAHGDWSALVHFTPDSVSVMNPWRMAGVPEARTWAPADTDALLLGGLDWSAMPDVDGPVPVVNLVQHLRHADPSLPLRAFLRRRAVRICVSDAVADAILATGEVNGPVRVIDAAITDITPGTGIRSGIVIDAIKQPDLGHSLAGALLERGLHSHLIVDRTARADYLHQLGQCEIAVLLPHAVEGFYLPGVEAMASGAACVVPDCVGNRGYLDPGRNALAPGLDVASLVNAVVALQDPVLRDTLRAGAATTVARYGQPRERRAFHDVLDQLDTLWTQ